MSTRACDSRTVDDLTTRPFSRKRCVYDSTAIQPLTLGLGNAGVLSKHDCWSTECLIGESGCVIILSVAMVDCVSICAQ